MARKGFWTKAGTMLIALSLLMSFTSTNFVSAQDEGPVMLDPRLGVRTVVDGLDSPTTMAFIGPDEFLVLEKNTGQVKHVMNGEIQGTVLDLAVNFASERGLLGIALHPDFPTDPGVYLYWSCIAPPPPEEDPFFPTQDECDDTPELGEGDTDDILAVPLLGNRVDRFVWDGAMLTYDHNLIMLRSFQNDGAPEPPDQGDEEQPPRGNHDGGVLTFGADGKLYIIVGDLGRRGQLQNLPCGPTDVYDCPGEDEMVPDDQFGGPEPDDAHLAGVILRLNPDGSIPDDNPLFEAGAEIGGEVGENIQMIFAYGIRNSFGMAVDPLSGNLWYQENGEDAFDELNLAEPGLNSGWIQIAGPDERLAEYKEIETTSLENEDFPNLQQFRWGPELIADTPEEALSRLFELPGSHYSDPEFSWKFVLAPAAIGFVNSDALGRQFRGDLFMGFSVPEPLGGPLFAFNLTGNRSKIGVDDPLLEDRVADNLTFHDLTESESLLIGQNFGVVTDIKTGPNGNLFVVSLSQGAVYEIFRTTGGDGGGGGAGRLTAQLSGAAEVPGPGDPDGTGMATFRLNAQQGEVCFEITVSNIGLPASAAHIHEGTSDVAGPVVVPLTPPDESGTSSGCVSDVDPALIQNILQNPEQYYANVHNEEFPDGAVRGQLARAGGDDDNGEDLEFETETEMTGSQEAPTPVMTDMTGNAEIVIEGGRLSFRLRVRNNTNDIFAAHIHCGAPGVAGPVGVTLFMGSFTDRRGVLAKGSVTEPDPENECGWTSIDDIARAILDGSAYVNVHTTEESGGFPSGEIRGDLPLPRH
ncbi:MAG TPA: CHRD domain-containing protein [Anaerolineales bacterium]|nr:CHRD domain-containing protein [Anaerolineales bacterium]